MSEPIRMRRRRSEGVERRPRAPREASSPVLGLLGLPGPGRHVGLCPAPNRIAAQLPTFSRVCKGKTGSCRQICLRPGWCRKSQRSSGAMSLLCCEKAEISATSNERWRRLLDGGRFTTESLGRQSLAGRIGEPPTTVGAHVVELVFDAICVIWTKPAIRAERALVGADACLRGCQWQIHVAVFTARAQFQRHGSTPSLTVRPNLSRTTPRVVVVKR